MDRSVVHELATAAAAATPPGHVDFATWAAMDRDRYWQTLLSGKGPAGPLEPTASHLLRSAGIVVGAAAVTVMPRSPWWPGGAWLSEIFVVPRCQNLGLGRRLLVRSLVDAAGAGHERIGLTVTEDNRAVHLYTRLGFSRFRATWFVELPTLA